MESERFMDSVNSVIEPNETCKQQVESIEIPEITKTTEFMQSEQKIEKINEHPINVSLQNTPQQVMFETQFDTQSETIQEEEKEPSISQSERSPDMPHKNRYGLKIPKVIQFKQEINKTIDDYINIHTNQLSEVDNLALERLLTHTMQYYDKMKAIYDSQYASDDDGFITDSDNSNGAINGDNDSDNYEKIMMDRVYANKVCNNASINMKKYGNVLYSSDESQSDHKDSINSTNSTNSTDLKRQEKEIRQKLFGLNYDANSSDETDLQEQINLQEHINCEERSISTKDNNDSSADPIIYDTNQPEEQIESDSDSDYISHNIKKKFGKITCDVEIIIDDGDINYDDPKIE